jgi:hypothetical protein
MEKTENMPLWVYLAFSSIRTRKGALLLLASSALFTAYCIPWSKLVAHPVWLGKIFLLDDWSWFAMMIPVTLWYWLSMRWVDRHAAWAVSTNETAGR